MVVISTQKSLKKFIKQHPIIAQSVILYMLVFSVHMLYAITHKYFGQDIARDVLLMENFIGVKEF